MDLFSPLLKSNCRLQDEHYMRGSIPFIRRTGKNLSLWRHGVDAAERMTFETDEIAKNAVEMFKSQHATFITIYRIHYDPDGRLGIVDAFLTLEALYDYVKKNNFNIV